MASNDESCHDHWSMASDDESCHDRWSMASNDESCHNRWSMASSNDPCSVRGEIPCAIEIPLICMTHWILAWNDYVSLG